MTTYPNHDHVHPVLDREDEVKAAIDKLIERQQGLIERRSTQEHLLKNLEPYSGDFQDCYLNCLKLDFAITHLGLAIRDMHDLARD